MSQSVEKYLTCNVEESFKKFLDPAPAADDFLHLIVFFLVERHISGKIFMKMLSAVFT